jgi:GxxExxY protein
MNSELLHADRVHSIVGCFFDVYNYFGYGLTERVYAGALAVELCQRRHEVVRELVVDVEYKGQQVARQRLDMVVDDSVVIEIKATEKLLSSDRMQLISYLRASSFEVGLLLHFGSRARFERFVHQFKKVPPKRRL